MASYLQAKSAGGDWLVRIEDVDETRKVQGAGEAMLRTLEAMGFEWQGEVIWQSQRKQRYAEVIKQLLEQRLAYRCDCSRSQIAAHGLTGIEGPVYPGTCRTGEVSTQHQHSIRLRVEPGLWCFDDLILGQQCQDISQAVGDFVIRRADGYTAYQLAVVIDDADQGINQVVRGQDLLASTPRQILLQHLLGLATPEYAHVPLVMGADGRKLSKQDQAHPVDADDPIPALLDAWRWLKQSEPSHRLGSVAEFWRYALTHWALNRLRLHELGAQPG